MSLEELKAAAAELGYVVVRPYDKVIVEGEGSDDEYELVPTSRQLVYETAINELHARLAEYKRR